MKYNPILKILFFIIIVGCNSYKNKITIRNKSLIYDSIKIVYEGIPNQMVVSLMKPDTVLMKSIATKDSFKIQGLKTDFNLSYEYRDIGRFDTLLFIKDGRILKREIYKVKENPWAMEIRKPIGPILFQ
jgi:hypothetical protein